MTVIGNTGTSAGRKEDDKMVVNKRKWERLLVNWTDMREVMEGMNITQTHSTRRTDTQTKARKSQTWMNIKYYT